MYSSRSVLKMTCGVQLVAAMLFSAASVVLTGVTVLDAGNGLEIIVDDAAGHPVYTVLVNGNPWLASTGSGAGAVSYLGSAPVLASVHRSEHAGGDATLKTPTYPRAQSNGRGGAFTVVTARWADTFNRSIPWETSFITNSAVPGAVVFRQTFTGAIENPATSWRGSNNFGCSALKEGHDQSGGRLLNDLAGQTAAQCCSACHKNASCNAWVMSGPYKNGYFYHHCRIYAGVTGTTPSEGNRMGGHPGPREPAAGDPNSVLAGFPTFLNGAAVAQAAAHEGRGREVGMQAGGGPPATPMLNTISWGGCQLSPGPGGTPGTSIGRWTNATTDASATQGIPLLLYAQNGKSLIFSPSEHFFVAVHSTMTSGLVAAGIKASVTNGIPAGTTYDTIMYTSERDSTNDTLVGWGEILLRKAGKARVDPYADFVLSHLGYWTDAGAYHYQDPSPYPDYESALLAVKRDAAARGIPFRYFQFDDWWARQRGDFGGDEGPLHLKAGPGGGLLYWQPRPHVFPSGLTDWLGVPLSLYAPAYSIDSLYINESLYTWAKDHETGHALPIDRRFYDALFANGTRAGMRMFEQDFMCAINTDTSLTNTDLNIGNKWLAAMDAAASDANITLQFCMMNPVHALATTTVKSVTNGRATRDNHPHQTQSTRLDPGNAGNGQVLGLSGMLHYALGIWPSRDNVWTNSSVLEHGGPEPMPLAQTLLAVLAGGPYGPSDAAGAGNRSLIMRSCRSDGVLLRPDKPVTMLDRALTSDASAFEVDFKSPRAVNVWESHSSLPNGMRWGYILGLNLVKPFAVYPADILPAGGSGDAEFLAWEYWSGCSAASPSLVRVTRTHPLMLPATGEPANVATIAASYYVLAPVLANGWAFLGEPAKIVAASSRRLRSVQAPAGGGGGLTAAVRGAANETATFAIAAPLASAFEVMFATCAFGSGANEVENKVTCVAETMRCTCTRL